MAKVSIFEIFENESNQVACRIDIMSVLENDYNRVMSEIDIPQSDERDLKYFPYFPSKIELETIHAFKIEQKLKLMKDDDYEKLFEKYGLSYFQPDFPQLRNDVPTNEVEELRIFGENIFKVSVFQVSSFFFKSIEIFYPKMPPSAKQCNALELSTNLFSWSIDDFLKRVGKELRTSLWSDPTKKFCFEAEKDSVDLMELKKFAKILFNTCIHKNKRSLVIYVFGLFQKVMHYVNYETNIKKEFNGNKKESRALENLLTASSFVSGSSIALVKKNLGIVQTFALSAKNFSSGYKYKWALAQEDQMALKSQLSEKNLENQIDEYNDKIQRDEYISRNAMDCYYSQIESLRVHLTDLTEKFNESYQITSETALAKKQEIQKLESIESFYRENLAYLAQRVNDIKIVQEKEKTEAQMRELRKQIKHLEREIEELNQRNEGKKKLTKQDIKELKDIEEKKRELVNLYSSILLNTSGIIEQKKRISTKSPKKV